jgi:hypothetical protein
MRVASAAVNGLLKQLCVLYGDSVKILEFMVNTLSSMCCLCTLDAGWPRHAGTPSGHLGPGRYGLRTDAPTCEVACSPRPRHLAHRKDGSAAATVSGYADRRSGSRKAHLRQLTIELAGASRDARGSLRDAEIEVPRASRACKRAMNSP